jgi:hypothetical protein
MYFSDSGEQLRVCDSEREYFVAAEIYISNAAGATLRKVSPAQSMVLITYPGQV